MSRILKDIHKIVDKKPKVVVTIVDKEPIPPSRGVADFLNKGFNREEIEHTYTMKQIIDNEDGPILVDDITAHDVYDKVERIIGMTDVDDSSLSIKLKPNGEFD